VAPSTVLDVAFGPHGAQRLDLYLPHLSSGEAAPIVVYLHAGGWVGGHEDDVPAFVMRFVGRGYAVASVGYRLAPEFPFPAAIHDVKHAVRRLKAYGDREGLIDGDRMVLVGTSAGGHLAAFAAATVGAYEPDVGPDLAGYDSSVAAVVSAVGPTDLTSFYVSGQFAEVLTEAFVGCSPCTEDELEEASPIHHLDGGLPPAYWAYGSDDALVDADLQGAAMADAWAAASPAGTSWLDVVDGQGHNLDETTLNQRHLETFVDLAIGRTPLDLP
jgi:acetyl esterase/lipase